MKLAQSKESKRQKQLTAAFLQKLHSFSCDLCVTLMSLTGKLPILELGTGTIHHEKTDDKKKGVHETPKLPRSVSKTCLQPRSEEETGVWQLSQLKHEIKNDHSPVHVDEECTMAVSIRETG